MFSRCHIECGQQSQNKSPSIIKTYNKTILTGKKKKRSQNTYICLHDYEFTDQDNDQSGVLQYNHYKNNSSVQWTAKLLKIFHQRSNIKLMDKKRQKCGWNIAFI